MADLNEGRRELGERGLLGEVTLLLEVEGRVLELLIGIWTEGIEKVEDGCCGICGRGSDLGGT